MKAVKTFEEFVNESSNYKKDEIFWDSLDVKEQNLIYKDLFILIYVLVF
jgi:hypothetical protein